MEGMNIGFFINIRKEVDCKDNRFKNEESYVRERRDTNNPAFSSFIHLLFVSRLSRVGRGTVSHLVSSSLRFSDSLFVTFLTSSILATLG